MINMISLKVNFNNTEKRGYLQSRLLNHQIQKYSQVRIVDGFDVYTLIKQELITQKQAKFKVKMQIIKDNTQRIIPKICFVDSISMLMNFQQLNILMRNFVFLILLIFSATVFCAEEPYKLVIHNTDPNAKCLDGTSPALYLHEGGDNKRFLVFFVGGGFCAGLNSQMVLQDCYQRAKTDLGSSNFYDKTLISPGGYLSTDPQISRFANWTKIVIMYCDGAQHQGHVENPVSYKDTKLYFRGAANTRSHFQWLINTYKINSAEKVLLTGASAGGIATFTWTNYMRSLIDRPENLYTIADSSIFANVSYPGTNYYVWNIVASNLFKVSNVDEKFPIQACNKKYPGEEWRCVFIQNSHEFLDSKIMFINSEYDPVGLTDTMNITCLKNGQSGKTLQYCSQTQMKNINNYRTEFLKDVNNLVNAGHSIWTIACCQHSYACYQPFYNVSAQKVPGVTGQTVAAAIDRFVFHDERVVIVDRDPWPSNEPCAF